jgi:hypothetical protein
MRFFGRSRFVVEIVAPRAFEAIDEELASPRIAETAVEVTAGGDDEGGQTAG